MNTCTLILGHSPPVCLFFLKNLSSCTIVEDCTVIREIRVIWNHAIETIFIVGGEASLLGSGGSILGIGSDIGGSLRCPAIFNGVYSLRPTHGRHLSLKQVLLLKMT